MPIPTGPQWSDFSPIEDPIPEGIGEVTKEVATVAASVVKGGFESASRGTQAATLATAAVGALGASGGVLSPSTGLLVLASSPALPFARQGVEHFSAKMKDPDRMSFKRTMSPSRLIKGLMDPPGTPKRR